VKLHMKTHTKKTQINQIKNDITWIKTYSQNWFPAWTLTVAHAITIEVTWKNVKFHLRLNWENKDKCVINRPKSCLSAVFDDVPEIIVEHCVQFISNPLVHMSHLSCQSGYFPNLLKIVEIQLSFKKVNEQWWQILDPYQYYNFFPKYWRIV